MPHTPTGTPPTHSPNDRQRVSIIGASGYVGAGLLRLLATHPNVEIVAATSRKNAGTPVAKLYPQLRGILDLPLENISVAEAASRSDLLFLALPHGTSANVVKDLFKNGDPDVKIIDMSGDFRLDSANTYTQHYHKKHPCPELLNRFVYGLSEWARPKLQDANFVANPGCFATAIGLGLAPLAAAKQLPPRVTVVAATGSTGSGMTPSRGTHHPERAANYKLYKILSHQHTPEICNQLERLGAKTKLSFIPASAPMTRGIFATIHMHTEDPPRLAKIIKKAYEDAAFVRVSDGSPQLGWCLQSNFADIGITTGDQELVIAIAIDNLMKGAASQAIQNFNLMMGLDERTGLSNTPPIP